MDRPQQPEIERSGRGNVDPEGRSASERGKSDEETAGATGPVPPGNRSTHGPEGTGEEDGEG